MCVLYKQPNSLLAGRMKTEKDALDSRNLSERSAVNFR